MEKRKCPEHFSTILTKKDTNCHSHESDTQQGFHNFHCRRLNCPHALHGKEKHTNVPEHPPRTTVEHLLKKLDRKK